MPPEAMTVAFLHDVIEHSDLTLDELDPYGLTPDERAALVLLTREPGETFEAQSLRIAFDRGPGGRSRGRSSSRTSTTTSAAAGSAARRPTAGRGST